MAQSFCQYSCLLNKWLSDGTSYLIFTIEFPVIPLVADVLDPRLKAEWGCCMPAAAILLMLPMYMLECDMNWDDIGDI